MVMAAELSQRLNFLEKHHVERVRGLISRAGLPVAGPAIAPETLMDLMAVDKKAQQGQLRFVLLEAVGRAALQSGIDEHRVREAIVAAAQ